jgi:nucleoside-diphosphate-sugar epimerase
LNKTRKKIIIGSNGNLAIQLKNQYKDAQVIGRREYLAWQKSSDIHNSLKLESCDIFVTIGVRSSEANSELLELINFTIPILIAEAISSSNSRIITFGTIMEKKPEFCDVNFYVESKYRLSSYLKNNVNPQTYLHLMLNTLYGGSKIHPDMFLGQLFRAIEKHSTFIMSSGKQLREYHHIDDDISALNVFLRNDICGVQEISHGECVTLEELARQVLAYFNLEDLLVLGKIDTSKMEIYEPLGIRHFLLRDLIFRPSIDGVISYLSRYL